MHVRGDNQYKTGADRENVLGQPILFECMGICVLSPAHESKMRGLPCLCADCKIHIPPILITFSHSILDWTVLSWNWGGGGGDLKKKKIFRGVCGPCHL